MIDNAVPVGDSYAVAGLSSGVTQIIAPSANTSGIIIRLFGISTHADIVYQLFTGPTAPTAFADFTKRLVRSFLSSNAETIYIPYPLSIKTGWGLWLATNASGGGYTISYDTNTL